MRVGEWTHTFRPKPDARARLFAFPYAGSGASIFRQWPALLPADVELCAIQLPGREARIRETALGALPPILASLVPALARKMDRPCVFFGHSYGATVAFEVVRQLLASGGRTPDALVVSSRPAPHAPMRYEPVHRLPDKEFLAAMNARYGAIPREVLDDQELVDLILPPLRADMTIVEQTMAQPKPPPIPTPILSCGGSRDAHVYREDLEAWRDVTHGTFTLEMFDGDHFYLNDAPHKARLLELIGQVLAAAR